MNVGRLGGLKIVENMFMVVPGEPYQVPRGWRERLFTMPWRPLRKERTVVPMVPSKEIIKLYDQLIMHPVTAIELRKIIQE